jgi:glycosyltransferase involved in cell wall biosynthesis
MAFSEAIAHGLPVVGTTAGALAETLPRNASVLVPVGDAGAGAGFETLIEQPQERDRLIAGARAVTFPSWREQGARFARILEASRMSGFSAEWLAVRSPTILQHATLSFSRGRRRL